MYFIGILFLFTQIGSLNSPKMICKSRPFLEALNHNKHWRTITRSIS